MASMKDKVTQGPRRKAGTRTLQPPTPPAPVAKKPTAPKPTASTRAAGVKTEE